MAYYGNLPEAEFLQRQFEKLDPVAPAFGKQHLQMGEGNFEWNSGHSRPGAKIEQG